MKEHANIPPMATRASSTNDKVQDLLGPLAELPGRWVGRGFNQISLPVQTGRLFRLKLNATQETLEFTALGAAIPNRGFKDQSDIFLGAVQYTQTVTDINGEGGLHFETGLWLNVPASLKGKPQLVRQAAVPHGDSLLASGAVRQPVDGGPAISPFSSIPTQASRPPGQGKPLGNPYASVFSTTTLPPGVPVPTGKKPADVIHTPALLLAAAVQPQTIVSTVTLAVDSLTPARSSGILNIPFVRANANASSLQASFWIETVQAPDGSTFLQLQYQQKVILTFDDIDWPHISVATLLKQ